MAEVLEMKSETGLAAAIDYGLVAADLQKRVEADLALTIEGPTDSAGYKICDTRRKEWVKVRTSIDRRRKEFNAAAREHIKRVDSVASELTEIAGQAEDHCTAEVDRIDAEIESERQAKLDATYNSKNDRLLAAGVTLDRLVVDSLTDEQIDQRCAEAIELATLRMAEAVRVAAAKVEADRLAAEQAEANRVEADRLAAERAEFVILKQREIDEAARVKKIEDDKLAAERAELDQQRRVHIEDVTATLARQAEAQRQIDEANEKLRRADADRLEEINQKRREAEAAEAARQKAINDAQAKAEADLRAEVLRPDRELLLAFAAQIENLHVPNVGPVEAVILIIGELQKCSIAIRRIVAEQVT